MPCTYTSYVDNSACHFNPLEDELIKAEGKLYCIFHLPETGKKRLTSLALDEFDKKIHQYADESLGTVNFEGTIFVKPVDFSGYDFGDKSVSFARAHFVDGDVDFQNATFGCGDINFSNAKFGKGIVRFNGVIFGKGKVTFWGIQVEECDFYFNFARFGEGEVSFAHAKFGKGKYVSFRNTNFGNGNVSFQSANFGSCHAGFWQSKFGDGKVDFSHACFGDENSVGFHEVKFGNGDVNFSFIKAVGKHGAGFSDCVFGNGKVNFTGAEFGDGGVRFCDAIFGNGDVCFKDVVFSGGDILFTQAKFGEGLINFDRAKFGIGLLNFRGANFGHGDISFRSSEFNGPVFFTKIEVINGNIDFSIPKSLKQDWTEVDFSGVSFKKNVTFENRVFFQAANFTNCAFDQAPNFHGCVLHEGTDFTDAIFNSTDYRHASYYRRLKLQMAQIMDKESHRNFFALEQKCRRNNPNSSRLDRSLSWSYQLSSDFGQNTSRPIYCILGLAIIGCFLFFAVGLLNQIYMSASVNPPEIIIDSVNFTFQQTVKPLSIWNLKDNVYLSEFSGFRLLLVRLLSVFYSILQVSFVALFLLSLRWRLKSS